MFTRDDLEKAYFKAHTSQLWLYCDKADKDAAVERVLAEINTPADSIAAGTFLAHPRTAEWGADMLHGLLCPLALKKFVSLLDVDDIVPMLRALKKSTFEGMPVIAISTRYIVRLRDIADEWNRQHDGESDKQIYLEPSHSW